MIRKAGLPTLLLLAALAAACQPGPSQAYLERVLNTSWISYRRHFITPEGQVRLPEQDGGAISEAQAYALLRALWANDAAAFARVYAWTYNHLSRQQTQGDHLLSWRWGRRPDGSWGLLDVNTAADADLDYALALLLAARRGWRAPPELPDYGTEAQAVAADILRQEVVGLPTGLLLLAPGNWHEREAPYLINPSYFSPGADHLLDRARHDPRWRFLRQSTYKLLNCLQQGLGDEKGVGLFPDWCQVDAAGEPGPAPGRDTRFGWEAVRLPFRVALDNLWFGDPQAARLLGRNFLPFFQKEWQTRHRLLAAYHYDGTPAVAYESPVMYAGVLAAALTARNRHFAWHLAQKILSFYQEKDGQAFFEAPDNYYANNWAWLGLALYAGWVRPF